MNVKRTLNANQWVIWVAAIGWWVFLILLCSETPSSVVRLPSGPVELDRDRVVPYDRPPTLREQPVLSAFGGYSCAASRCGRHVAGYRWAEKRNVTNPDSCDGDSTAFIEGCRVYARSAAAGPK